MAKAKPRLVPGEPGHHTKPAEQRPNGGAAKLAVLALLTRHQLHQAESHQAPPAAGPYRRLQGQPPVRLRDATRRRGARSVQAGAQTGHGLRPLWRRAGAALPGRPCQAGQLLHLWELARSGRQPGSGVRQPGGQLLGIAVAAGGAQHRFQPGSGPGGGAFQPELPRQRP